jgi:membrane protease YdiL (CAAX protease family)
MAAISWNRLPGRGAALSNTVSGLLVVCGLELLLFSVVFALGWFASRASRDALLLRWRPGWWVLPLGVGYSVAIRMAVGLVMAAVAIFLIVTKVVDLNSLQDFVGKNRPDVETVVDINAMKQNPVYFWLTITLVSFVVAGLREELWRSGFLAGLRTLFPRTFGSRRGEVLAVFLIAVIFGAAHANMGILAVAMTGVLGIFLGLIMVFHRSIWPAVLAHGFFDATSMALLPWVMDYIKKAQ